MSPHINTCTVSGKWNVLNFKTLSNVKGMGGIKFWDSVEESDADGPSSITFRMEYLFAF